MGAMLRFSTMGVSFPVLLDRRKERGKAMTLEEWGELPEDELGELVDGYLEDEEVPSLAHELTVTWLTAALRTWLDGRGFVFGSGIKLRISSVTGRIPDASIVLPSSRPPPRKGILRRPPDVVIEIVTPSARDERRDRVEKMTDYARARIRYYWLIDPALGAFEVFELTEAGTYARALAATEGRLTVVPGCDGLVFDLDALWTELERLGPESDEDDADDD